MPVRPALARLLDLEPHPEGGWYRQTWRSPVDVTLPDGRGRPTATLIYFLLPPSSRVTAPSCAIHSSSEATLCQADDSPAGSRK